MKYLVKYLPVDLPLKEQGKALLDGRNVNSSIVDIISIRDRFVTVANKEEDDTYYWSVMKNRLNRVEPFICIDKIEVGDRVTTYCGDVFLVNKYIYEDYLELKTVDGTDLFVYHNLQDLYHVIGQVMLPERYLIPEQQLTEEDVAALNLKKWE